MVTYLNACQMIRIGSPFDRHSSFSSSEKDGMGSKLISSSVGIVSTLHILRGGSTCSWAGSWWARSPARRKSRAVCLGILHFLFDNSNAERILFAPYKLLWTGTRRKPNPEICTSGIEAACELLRIGPGLTPGAALSKVATLCTMSPCPIPVANAVYMIPACANSSDRRRIRAN
jgi:hypothetical protein